METTCIKLHDDISGDRVTLDFEKLLLVASIATGKTKQDLYRAYSELDNALMDSNYVKAELRSKNIVKEAELLRDSVHVLHTLAALKEDGNRREKFRLYNLDQEAVTLIYEPK